MSLKLPCILCALAIGISGCVSSGNETLKSQDRSTVEMNIVDGKTTRDDILRIYGNPTQTTFTSNKSEVWVYSWAHRTPQAQNFIPLAGPFVAKVDVQQKRLIILFDSQNVVAKHSFTEASTTARRDFSSSSSTSSKPSATTSPQGSPSQPQ
jgi:outer membrane protein assembly factor BamE (lipoprotein component of BamABCDE complex)